MLKSRSLKSVLIPTLGISAIGLIAAVSTSCGKKDDPSSLQSIIITANEDSSFGLLHGDGNNPNLQYSADGTNWNVYSGTQRISIPSGTSIYLRGDNPNGWSHSDSKYSTINIKGNASVSGNIMALLDNGAGTVKTIPCNNCFSKLFAGSNGITSVDENLLPSTGLTDECYRDLFRNCSSIVTPPELPATTLASGCYKSMFNGCTWLVSAPNLPATTLAEKCYQGMFYNCSTLSAAPELPAITLADYCYTDMFNSCISLTNAPELPATELNLCCYRAMFQRCTSLKSVKIGYTGNYDASRFDKWADGVNASGTFYYNGEKTPQDFGFPAEWVVQPYGQ